MKTQADQLPNPRASERARWMERVQAGDGDAYRLLLESVSTDLRAFFRRRVREAQEVEDHVQEALLTLHRARHTYDPSRPFEPWLFAIARNTVVNAYRRGRLRAQVERLSNDGEPIDTVAEEPSRESPLDQLLGGLPENQRDALEMVKLKGMTIEQAAEHAGISQGAMRVRVHRGYRALRARLLGSDE